MKATHHASAKAAIWVLLWFLATGCWTAAAASSGPDGVATIARAEDGSGPADPPPGEAPSAEGQDQSAQGTNVPTGVYRGVVLERRNGKPVGGAQVVFINQESGDTFTAVTDEKGAYEMRLPAGEYVVDIKVGKKTYRSAGTFKEETPGKRWVMDFTIGSKLTEKDLKIATTPRDIRVLPTEPRPPLEPSRKMMELWIFLGGLIAVAALAD